MPPAAPRSPAPRAFAALVLIGAAVVAARSFGGWFLDDDLLNMRWVLEHRDAPWAALTQLHSLHGHIRPLNLLAHWLGARLADGEWWGPHLVLVTLWVGAVAATMAWAPRAAPLAGALLLATTPSERVLTWNAWMGSAGEAAFGLLAMALASLAVRRGRPGPALGALVAIVAAGLFKEPGWILYPAGCVALAARPSVPRSVRAPLLAALIVGAAGLVLVWNPANSTQYFEDPVSFSARLWSGSEGVGRALVGSWHGAGLVAPLVAGALWHAALEGRSPRRMAWILTTVTTVLLLAVPSIAGFALLASIGAAVIGRRREPPAELVVAAASIGVMLPDPDLHAVHLLPAAAGLAVFVAGEIQPLLATPARFARPAVAVLLAWQGALLAVNVAGAAPLSQELVLRDHLRPLAALYATLAPDALVLPPSAETDAGEGPYLREATRYLAPYFGAEVRGEGEAGPTEGFVAALPGVSLLLPPDRQERLLRGNALASYGVRLDPGAAVAVPAPAGWYAIGALRMDGRTGTDPALTATDACGRRWEALPTSGDQRLSLTPLELEAACVPLKLTLSGPPGPGTIHLVLPLTPPRWSLAAAPAVPPRLDVASRGATRTPIPRFDAR